MAAEVERLLEDGAARDEQIAGLHSVRASLGQPGAPKRVAEEIERFL
jgi:lipid-A-disaccharide synthase